MTYPPQPGNWPDPSWSGQQSGPQSGPPVDPTLPAGSPVAPTPDPYAPGNPYAGAQPSVDPYGNVHKAGDPYAPGYPPAPYGGYGYAPQPQKTNGLAIAALVLALVGFASCITAPVGAILGHVARKQIRQTGEGGEGMAKAAIIVGWIVTGLALLFIAFYVVIVVFAIASSDGTSTSNNW
ncbi:DUF4190 domain-containing protein [Micromonospora endolithica]|uniref:DUF4190 domain-containing protein n=1 Tax=Micromonospora endolithica TaxID=230091 RepID=A0A3A9Z5A7_9ACTN|nr:DUF4190 domain-containing protein [Micromonospora endolithica]RKN43571.1 DUF4190 domain-containing protein [Micromonospora endolithica]TWJ24172.1 uncharacterized protein DUF4190 [Micromonospora endolithica]